MQPAERLEDLRPLPFLSVIAPVVDEAESLEQFLAAFASLP